MFELMILLLCVFIVLLIVQIVALLRIRQLISRLKQVILDKKLVGRSGKQGLDNVPRHHQKCQYCKYRQTFINATIHGGENDFYYRCMHHNVEVSLSQTCKAFEFEEE
jgi:hypothetical protein